MQDHIDRKIYHVEVLCPKQNEDDLDAAMEKFATKYEKVMEMGYCACLTDNPMGKLSFQGHEMISELELSAPTDQVMIHLNTFHTKENLHEILDTLGELGIKHLLVISGDGSERLPKLEGSDVGMDVEAVTSVELMQYIEQRYPGAFNMGVAYNPYEPQDHELEKMQRKVDAGARFMITQPIIEQHENIETVEPFGIPIILECWMLKKIHLISECVGYEIPEDTVYDPVECLKTLHANYPECGMYLAFLGMKTQAPLLSDIWK